MSYLLDANILIRLVNKRDRQHLEAQEAVILLQNQGMELAIVSQNLIEFWAVATRPVVVNGLGLTIEEAAHESLLLKQLFTLKSDDLAIHRAWEDLVIRYQVKGKQIYDTRLVAAMMVHDLSSLLTFNIEDFSRFTEITAIAPHSIQQS